MAPGQTDRVAGAVAGLRADAVDVAEDHVVDRAGVSVVGDVPQGLPAIRVPDLGNVDVTDLRAKIEDNRDQLAALMITYPSTHGVYDADVREVCDAIHAAAEPSPHPNQSAGTIHDFLYVGDDDLIYQS